MYTMSSKLKTTGKKSQPPRYKYKSPEDDDENISQKNLPPIPPHIS